MNKRHRVLDQVLMRLLLEHRDQHRGRVARHVEHRLVDGGQARPDDLRDRAVVEPGDRQVARHVDAQIVRGHDRAGGHIVILREDRRRSVAPAEQARAGLQPGFEVEHALLDIVQPHLQPGGAEGIGIAEQAAPRSPDGSDRP